MKVAISGISGLVGTALRTNLTADSHEVLALSRRASLPPLTTITWDIESGRQVRTIRHEHWVQCVPARRERSYITNGISCLSFVMYFSKKCFCMSFISSSRPWM